MVALAYAQLLLSPTIGCGLYEAALRPSPWPVLAIITPENNFAGCKAFSDQNRINLILDRLFSLSREPVGFVQTHS